MQTGVSVYDFRFDNLFCCRRPYEITDTVEAIARIGAIDKYQDLYESLKDRNIVLINNPKEHRMASELTDWYPLIEDLTPKSQWFNHIPTVMEITSNFDFPIFIKGSRQTSKHDEKLSIARSKNDLEYILNEYYKNDILHWQKLVCREYVNISPVKYTLSSYKVTPGFEFRTFWLNGDLVGAGHYWSGFCKYDWDEEQKIKALKIAQQAVDKLQVPFLVVDLALTVDNNWIVIECNDGQESGYAGISPIGMWNQILDKI